MGPRPLHVTGASQFQRPAQNILYYTSTTTATLSSACRLIQQVSFIRPCCFSSDPSSENYLYVSPVIIPTATYVFWTLSLIFFDILPFMMLRYSSIFIFPFVFTSTICTYYAIYNTAVSVARVTPILKRKQLKADVLVAPGLPLGGGAFVL